MASTLQFAAPAALLADDDADGSLWLWATGQNLVSVEEITLQAGTVTLVLGGAAVAPALLAKVLAGFAEEFAG